MYTRYFGLHEKPFAIAPDPRYLYMSDLHKEALAHLLYGINSDGCIILLTGDVGTGKTTVCRFLFDQLPETTDTAIILNPKLTSRELLVTICDELEITDNIKGTSTKSYLDALNYHLLKSHSEGRTTALFIDEAQNLNMGVLEQLRLLTNLETDKQKLLKIVLLGQTELRTQLERPEASQINQRVTSRYHLLPLEKQDIYTYIHHRMEIAGGGKTQFFTEKALKRVYPLSRGIPRLINVICDRALLGAYAEGTHQVDTKILQQAASEVLGNTGYRHAKQGVFRSIFSAKSFLGFALFVLLTLGMSFFFTRNNFSNSTQSPKNIPASIGTDSQTQPDRQTVHTDITTVTVPAEKETNTSQVILEEPVQAPVVEKSTTLETNINITPIEVH